MGRFFEVNCPYCGYVLPALPHYKNQGLILVLCRKCGRSCYINQGKALKRF